jgi:hypothetical protein
VLLLQRFKLHKPLPSQLRLLVPRLGDLLELRLPFGSELFLGNFRLVSLLQLCGLLGELLGRCVAFLLQLVELGLALAASLACSSRAWVSC